MDKLDSLMAPGNVVLTFNEYYSILSQSATFIPFAGFDALYIFGKRVIRAGKHIVLYEACGYCGAREIEKGLYDYILCASCGAPIYG